MATLNGSSSNDTLIGGSGYDSLVGGAGNDRYVVDITGANATSRIFNTIVDTQGVDTLIFSGTSAEMTAITGSWYGLRRLGADLVMGVFNNDANPPINGVVIKDQYLYANGQFNNTIDTTRVNTPFSGNQWREFNIAVTGPNANYLIGTSGSDFISGYGGNQTLVGRAGDDALSASRFDQQVSSYGSLVGDKLYGGDGQDELNGRGGNDSLYGGNGDDTLLGGGGNDLLIGNSGSDRAVFSGKFSDYTISFDATTRQIQLIDKRTPSDSTTGTDLVSGVESFVFSDVTKQAYQLNVAYGVDLNGSADESASADSGFGPNYFWGGNGTALGYQRSPGSNIWQAEVGLEGGIRAIRISTTTAGDSLPSNIRLSWKLGWDSTDQTTGEPTSPLAPRIDFANPGSAPQAFTFWDSSSSSNKNLMASASSRVVGSTVYDLILKSADGSPLSNEFMTQLLRSIYLGYRDGTTPPAHERIDLDLQVSVTNDATLQNWVGAASGQTGQIHIDFGNVGPQAFQAHYHDSLIQVAFKSSNDLPTNLADTFNPWQQWMGEPDKALFKVLVDGRIVAIKQIVMSEHGLLLKLNEDIPATASQVSISYTDPDGNQVKNVIQDWRGNDAFSFANLPVTPYAGPGMVSQALSDALLGVQLSLADGTGIYFSDSSGFDRQTVATVTNVDATTYKVKLVGNQWDVNPAFDPLATTGFQSMAYSRELITLELVKPTGASLAVGQKIALEDLVKISRNEQLKVFTNSFLATNDRNSNGTQFNYNETTFNTPVALWHVGTGQTEMDWSNDLLIGSSADDVLTVGAGEDTLQGGAGNDRYETSVIARPTGARIEDASGSNDVFVYTQWSGATPSIGRLERVGNDLVMTTSSWADGTELGRITVVNHYTTGTIERFEWVDIDGQSKGSIRLSTGLAGTPDSDWVTGSSAAETLSGDAGRDLLMGAAGNDTIDGGDGNDELYGGASDDLLLGGAGDDTYDWNGREAGSDTITDTEGANTLYVEAPGFMLDGQVVGNDLFLKTYASGGVTSSVRVTGQSATTGIKTLKIFRPEGNLSYDYQPGLTGTSGNDWLVGTANPDSMVGGAGGDFLLGGNGNDTLEGGSGNDRLFGGDGTDTAKFSGNFNQYVVRWDPSIERYLVNDLRAGMDGVDALGGVELFQFSDVTKSASDLMVSLGVDLNGAADLGTNDGRQYGSSAYWQSNWTDTGYQRSNGISFYRAEIGLTSGIKAMRISADISAAELSQKGVLLDWRLGWDNTSQATGEPVALLAQRFAFAVTGTAKQSFQVYDPKTSSNVSLEASYATHTDGLKTYSDLIIQATDGSIVNNDLMQSVLGSIGLVYRDPATQPMHSNVAFDLLVTLSADLQTWTGAGPGQLGAISVELDNTPPHILAARYQGKVLELTFDDGANLPESLPNVLDGDWAGWQGHPDKSLFTVLVNGRSVSVLNAVMSDSGVCLLLSESIQANAASVTVTYTDPAGNQIQHVIQDGLGNDTATTSLSASYFAGLGITAEVLPGAESGYNLFGNSDGPYIQEGGYLNETDVGRVTAVTADKITVVFEASGWGENPSYAAEATQGLGQYLFTHDRIVFELQKPSNSTLTVGSTLDLDDLIGVNSAYRATSITAGLAAANSIDETAGTYFELARFTFATPAPAYVIVTGGAGNAWGNDTLRGGAHDDVLYYTGGVDSLEGGAGNDTYRIINDLGSGLVVISDAGGSQDTFAGQNLAGGLALFSVERVSNNLVIKGYEWNNGALAFTMTIKDQYTTGTIENFVSINEMGVVSAPHVLATTLSGGDANEYLFGTAGAETISGGAGNDDLYGAAGNDSLLGGAGDDVLRSGPGSDTLDGGTGNDLYRWIPRELGQDLIQDASGNNDALKMDAPGYRLDAERVGSDLLLKAYSNGVLASSVVLKNQWNGQTIESIAETNPYGSSDTISFRADAGATSGNDWIVGDATADTLTGNDGADWLFGGAGNDVLTGGAGNDRLAGGDGQDIAVFSGASTAYTRTISNGGYQITGPDGTDQLFGIETLRFSDVDVNLVNLNSGVHLSVTPKFWNTSTVIQGVTPYIFKTETPGKALLKVQVDTDLSAGTFVAKILNAGTEPLRSFGFAIDLDASVAANATVTVSSSLTNWTTVNDTVSHRVGGYNNDLNPANYIQANGVVATVTGKLPSLLQDQAILSLSSVETNSEKDATGTMLKMDVTDSVTTQTGKISAYDIYNLAPGQYSVNIPSSAYAIPEGTVTADDAFKALELALGKNVVSSTTPYQLMAADINQDGRVTAFDAYSLLQIFAKSANALPQEFVFVDPTLSLASINRLNVKYPEGRTVDQPTVGELNVDLVGVLLGDVNASYGSM